MLRLRFGQEYVSRRHGVCFQERCLRYVDVNDELANCLPAHQVLLRLLNALGSEGVFLVDVYRLP